jgi:Ca-activated chloride channel family protein
VKAWIHFESIEMLHLIWLVPALGLLTWLAGRRAVRALRRLTALGHRLAPVDRRRRRWRSALSIAALALIVFALTRPGWNAESVTVHQEGRDVVFVVDVSRSMLAEDLAPNRLERAKLAILDVLPTLEGDRVALVAFAGSATLVCPLTRDYAFFRWAVESLSPAHGGGEGTLIGDAIRKVATDLFDPLERRYKDLILISDGEDQESFPVDAAAAAAEQGVRIIAIGLGDDQAGSRIPVVDSSSGGRTFLTYRGREVWTRLEAETMRGIALATPGGRYLHAATGAFDLGAIYRELVTSSEGRDLGPVEITRYREQFQLFLGAAFVLLIVQSLLSERTGRRQGREP